MKTPSCIESVTLTKSHCGDHTRPGTVSNSVRGLMLLSEVHDHEVLHLPEIHVPGKELKTSSAPPLRNRSVSALSSGSQQLETSLTLKALEPPLGCKSHSVLQLEARPDGPITTTRNVERVEKVGLVQITLDHEQPLDDGTAPLTRWTEASCSAGSGDSRMSSTPLLTKREQQLPLKLRDRLDVFPCHTQTQQLGTHLLASKHRPYMKSHSQREFSMEEKESGLPDIFGHGPTTKSTRGGVTTRSSSVLFVLPALPSRLICSKSSSQPDMFPPASPTRSEASPSSPSLARKRRRIRTLWKRAGEKLGICMENSVDGECLVSEAWAEGPGDVLRPVYCRWGQRRHALAEPERMCMPQVVRERIQKDADSRRRSMRRKVSNFLNVRLGLNLEEDLAA